MVVTSQPGLKTTTCKYPALYPEGTRNTRRVPGIPGSAKRQLFNRGLDVFSDAIPHVHTCVGINAASRVRARMRGRGRTFGGTLLEVSSVGALVNSLQVYGVARVHFTV